MPNDLTIKMRVYMRNPKATSASAWKAMPKPRILGTLLSPARAGSEGGFALVADMVIRFKLSSVEARSLASGGKVGSGSL